MIEGHTISMDDSLWTKIDDFAKKNKMNRSQCIAQLVKNSDKKKKENIIIYGIIILIFLVMLLNFLYLLG